MRKFSFLILSIVFLNACNVASQDGYVNLDIGFRIQGPRGWYKKLGEGGAVVSFTETRWENFPIFSVILEELPSGGENLSVLDFSEKILSDFQNRYQMKIVEPPKEIELRGIRGATFVIDVANVKRATNQTVWTRNYFYQFLKGEKVVSVLAMVESDRAEKYQNIFEEAANSFQWIQK